MIDFETLKSNIIILIARCKTQEDMVRAFEEMARQFKEKVEEEKRK